MAEERVKVASKLDFKTGQMKTVEVGDKKILISKVNGGFYATGATCTHYGAPLDRGVLHGDKIVCPWHHASFNARTGEIEEPPAHDCLETFKLEFEGDDIYIIIPEDFENAHKPKMAEPDPEKDNRTFVILGCGASGNMAAETLRSEGFKGRILMISEEERIPYDRPNLSKDYLQGSAEEEWMPLRSKEFYENSGIELKLGTKITGIEPDKKELIADLNDRFSYDKLLLFCWKSH